MKYAIVEISGRQFWLKQVNIMILIEFYRIRKTNYFNRVLLLNNGGDLLIGKPYLESVKIKGKF
jgi:ribosomal protein L21